MIPTFLKATALLLCGFSWASAKVVTYNLNVTLEDHAADCFKRPSVLINGGSPGPEIHVRSGDQLIVNLQNSMAEAEFTLHFHGIIQRGTPYSDGVPYLTQAPIAPGGSYKYVINIGKQVGTYFYHSHTDASATTAYGALIVHEAEEVDSPFDYDEERVLLLAEVFHKTDVEITNGLMGIPKLDSIVNPDSLVLNGKTFAQWNCTSQGVRCDNTCEREVVTVEPGKTYRFRIINAAFNRVLSFGIEGHLLTIIEADGSYVVATPVDQLHISPGQRYSAIVHTHHQSGNFYMKSELIGPTPAPNNGLGILHYADAVKPDTRASNPVVNVPAVRSPKYLEEFDLFKPLPGAPSHSEVPFPEHYDREIVIEIRDSGDRSFLNGVSYQVPAGNMLQALLSGKRSTHPDYRKAIMNGGYDAVRESYPIRYGEVIQVVLQNTYLKGAEVCLTHPFHLHGYSVYDLGGGYGKYDAQNASLAIQRIKNPLYRDVVNVYGEPGTGSYGNPCGYRVIRFVADNPGVWLFHCHITPHMMQGMQTLFETGVEKLASL
ncbi:hypothetical protein K493DRAFT_365755 [Basidiobolus meristosporus CBS 931.73]|uniref:Uncharacterized protein n=1 Tax=Basidiobolus meristosporus CBS 931.73 TaxID=1314790 RepID=A0A1Y1YMB8_9FUNG|nr:hypothetical protein K493DRAFT_365755 [Basidiobolus meristosporus CBS 931.73]|eukprot:ORX99152.1 hypothetical protein K493DRAFT_365755 [Basidiobolus meristosporus CBS 931.73]